MKKQLFLFLLLGVGFVEGFFGPSVNAMAIRDLLNPVDGDEAQDGAFARVVQAPAAVGLNAEQAPVIGGPAGIVRRPVLGQHNGQGPALGGPAAQVPANRQSVGNVLKKLFTAPWELGLAITSRIHNSTTNVEPASRVLARCLLEGFLCGMSLYFASGDGLGAAANRRWNLAEFALEDVFSATPFHYTSPRLWIAISGLQYLVTFLGLSGLRLYTWIFGVIIGARFAYDLLIKLPISVVSGRGEAHRGGLNPWRRWDE